MPRPSDKGVHISNVVINRTLVSMHYDDQSCIDPNTINAPLVAFTTGYNNPIEVFSIKRLVSIQRIKKLGSMRSLDINTAEDTLVKNTCEIVPGLIVSSIELSEANRANRTGKFRPNPSVGKRK